MLLTAVLTAVFELDSLTADVCCVIVIHSFVNCIY
jgi:hypothetical protein